MLDGLGQQQPDPAQDEKAAEKALARIPKLFRERRVVLGHLLVVVQSGSLKSPPKGIDPKLQCTVKVEGGAGETEPMPTSKHEWNTEFQFPLSEYTSEVEVSLNTSRVDLVTQETRWIKEGVATFQISVSERIPWKEAKSEQLQLTKGGKRKAVADVSLTYRFIPRPNRWLQLDACLLNPAGDLAKALLVVDPGVVSQQEYARALLTVFWFNGRERDIIRMAVEYEIFTVFEKIDDITQLLRGPTLSAMILSEYMHVICEPYLTDALAPLVRSLAQNPPHFELDPSRLDKATLEKDLKRNQKGMTTIVNKFMKKLISSSSKLPPDMGYLCRILKDAVTTRFSDNPSAWTIAMGALIFLRFICPVIVTPKEFGLVQSDCAPAGTRCLVLVSKILTNLVNNVEFGGKETHMACMNPFLEKYKTKPMELYNSILKKKDGYVVEEKIAKRAVDEETYKILWQVIDRVADNLSDTLATALPDLRQIISQLREADRIEKEEREKAEEAKRQRKEKREKKEKASKAAETKEVPVVDDEASPSLAKKESKRKKEEKEKKEESPKDGSTKQEPDIEATKSDGGGSEAEKTDEEDSAKKTPRGEGSSTNTSGDEALKSPKGKKKTDSPAGGRKKEKKSNRGKDSSLQTSSGKGNEDGATELQD